MKDLIDRQTLMDGYKHMGYDSTEHPEESYMEGWCKGFNSGVEHCIHHLIHAPSAREEGAWVDCSDDGYVECPFCGSATNCDDNINELHYCFSCGAHLCERSGK